MRWENTTTGSDNEVYQLWHNDEKLLTLTLNQFSSAARVECNDERRVFLIRKEGFRRNKTVLRNEYGIKLGELGQLENKRFIDLNDERFFYDVAKDGQPRMILYKDNAETPVLECGIQKKELFPDLKLGNAAARMASYTGLLMALCWYILLPASQPVVPALS